MLYSTKRKWDKLINPPAKPAAAAAPSTPSKSAAAPPTTSTPASPADSPTPAATPPTDPKKARTSRPSVRAVSPTGSLRNTHTTVSTLSKSTHATFSPWDRDAFLVRLSTYRFVDKWSAKPAAVNEVAWARRGWVCYDKNRVRCVMCRKEVLVRLESDDDTGVVARYEEMVVGEHDESCLWRKRGCDESIYRLPLSSAAVARPAFAARYTSLVRIRNEIPPSLSYPSDEVDPAALHYPSECSNLGPVFETAAMLALFGWQNEDPGIPNLVTCSACFRRLGLWLFQKKESVEGEGGEASVYRLDLVGEHRDYCPWINADSQGKEAGWMTLHRILQKSPKGASGSASVYSIASIAASEHSEPLTNAERDAEDDSKLKKLRQLKNMYFGKGKKRDSKIKENEH